MSAGNIIAKMFEKKLEEKLYSQYSKKVLRGDSAKLVVTNEQPGVMPPYMAFSLGHAVNNHAPPIITLASLLQ